MDRKKKSNGLLISGLISALASLAIVAVAPSFAGDSGPEDKPSQAQSGQGEAQSAQAKGESNQASGQAASSSNENAKAEPAKSEPSPDSTSTTTSKSSKSGSSKPSSSSEPVTEDNDNDGVANAPDPEGDADNKHPSGKDKHVEAGGSGNQGKAQSDPDDDGRGPDRTNGGVDQPGGSGGDDQLDQDGNNGCGNDDDFEDDNEGWCGKPVRTKPVQTKPGDTNKETCPDGSVMPANGKCEKPDEVGGEVITKPTCPDGSVMPAGGNCGEDIPCPDGTVMNADGNCLEENPSTPEENPEIADEVLGEQLEKDKDKAVTLAKDKAEGPSVLGLRLSPALNQPVKVAGAVLPFTGGDVLVFLVLALVLFAGGALIMRTTGTKANQS